MEKTRILLINGNEYFGDASHLNRKGMDKFSNYIKIKYKDIFYKNNGFLITIILLKSDKAGSQ